MCRLFACGGGGVLADDMGLGKTVQVIEALRACAASVGGGGSYIALAVVPLSVIPNWTAEALKWWPGLRITQLVGAAAAAAAAAAKAMLLTTNMIPPMHVFERLPLL